MVPVGQNLIDGVDDVLLADAVVQVDEDDAHLLPAQVFRQDDPANRLDQQN